MIEEEISIHDKYQFEVKLGYELETNKEYSSYKIEYFLFIPISLGINSETYSKKEFYSDIQTYIRFKAPTILLQDIVEGTDTPLSKLKISCIDMVKNNRISEYEHQIKMFCCILKDAIRDHVNFTCKSIISDDLEDLIHKFITQINKITSGYRELRSIIHIPTINNDVFSKYLFGDEYISILIESFSLYLIEEIEKKDVNNKKAIIDSLFSLIRSELNWRKKHNYPSIANKDSDNEVFLFRNSVLKKYMGSVLFLNTRVEKEGAFAEHVIYGISAGLAMGFATAVAFYSQYIFGNMTLPLFMALVISYIFKDRIKDILKLYFKNKINNVIPDHKRDIYVDSGNKIGICKEIFDFINERHLDNMVMKLRNRDHITEIENSWLGERIIIYRKHIKLFSNKIQDTFYGYNMAAINDIMRFNIMRFLNKMDNPQKEISVVDDSGYCKVIANRVYHLNLIVRYEMGSEVIFKRLRIILNRNGIKKIEEVSSDRIV